MGTTKTVAELVLMTEEEKTAFLGLERALRDLHGDGRTDLAPGEDALWTWMPKHGRIFHYAAERFPGFSWKPVVRAIETGGRVRLCRFVEFERFPTVGGRTLTVQELLTVDPKTVDPPRVKTARSAARVAAEERRRARIRRRAAGLDDMFV